VLLGVTSACGQVSFVGEDRGLIIALYGQLLPYMDIQVSFVGEDRGRQPGDTTPG
jgi:hypothetical protein